MPSVRKTKTVRPAKKKQYVWGLVVLGVAALVLLLVFVFSNNGGQLPRKYASHPLNQDSQAIVFNGVDAGEGFATIHKGETVRVGSDFLYAKDIYIALGQGGNPVVLKNIKGPVRKLSTEVTIPKDYDHDGGVTVHIYYTMLDDEAADRWTEVYVPPSSN